MIVRFLASLLRSPVFVFQMGKVGSSSIVATLRRAHRGLVVQAHNESTFTEEARRVLTWRRRLGLPVYVVCPVRDPISRNISSFFQNFERDTGGSVGERQWTMPKLRRLFLSNFPHTLVLEWFDRNLRTTFGVDVFAERFPVGQRWHVYRRGAVRVLVYRVDLPHDEQLRLLSRFLGLPLREWTYDNVSRNKEYAALYDAFMGSVRLPEVYVSMMCGSRLCRRFWDKHERAALAERWSARTAEAH